jgi:ribosomal protein L37AE/L43A
MSGASPAEHGSQAGDGGQAGTGSPAGERQVPFFCPYCGEEELRPSGSKPGGWECRSCARGFELKFAGLVSAGAGAGS